MKQLANKTELRAALEDEMRKYLEDGGTVQNVARGISGHDSARAPLTTFRSYSPRPREERTYVPEVVAAIESRRKRAQPPPTTRARKPRLMRRAVFDDFGEPIRYEWVEPT